jgi:hypothetical protein
MADQQFDVFMAHSSQDKPLIRQIYRQLKARGLRPWLDEEEIAPGTKFQDEIQEDYAIVIKKITVGNWSSTSTNS